MVPLLATLLLVRLQGLHGVGCGGRGGFNFKVGETVVVALEKGGT